jgi:hypothetical protein
MFIKTFNSICTSTFVVSHPLSLNPSTSTTMKTPGKERKKEKKKGGGPF